MRCHMRKYYNRRTTSVSSLPGVGITSRICLLTATLADKDNTLSDALLSDNSSKSQGTFVEGQQVHSQMAHSGMYSASACSVSKSHNEYTDIKCNARDLMRLYRNLGGDTLGLYVNTLEYTELLNGLIFDRAYGN